ncbi:MAG: hypothetical protein LC790_22260, partial [Actinobacteria bacterium]|nr:hypothetical protein [Actinomycetota bacterium]
MAAIRRRRLPKPLPSCAWALDISWRDPRLERLSPAGRRGHGLAREIGEYARERSLANLGQERPQRISRTSLAADAGIRPTDVDWLIERAKLELFGRLLSERGLRARRARDRQHGSRAGKPCEGKDCTRRLPAQASRNRRYCDFHLASHSRVRRYRARRSAAAKAAATSPDIPDSGARGSAQLQAAAK